MRAIADQRDQELLSLNLKKETASTVHPFSSSHIFPFSSFIMSLRVHFANFLWACDADAHDKASNPQQDKSVTSGRREAGT
jgi:hypothetical protein